MENKYIIPTIEGNKLEIYDVNNQIIIDGLHFDKIETIYKVKEGKFIPIDKIEKYSSKGLVKSLSDFIVEDINVKLKFCEFKLNDNKVKEVPGVYIYGY